MIRLWLLGAAWLLMTLAGKPLLLLDVFAGAMMNGLVAPICASMGFAATLGASGLDRQLVLALNLGLRHSGRLLVPGCVLAAYLCNLAIPSQASTAAALGPVLLPVLRGAGLSAAGAASVLVLGASFGGDLLNPSAQDVLALAGTSGLDPQLLGARLRPACVVGILVAAGAMFFRHQVRPSLQENPEKPHWGLAFLPLLPVFLLLGSYAHCWGLDWVNAPSEIRGVNVVRAMLVGVVAVSLACRRQMFGEFFDGMGRAYANIISLTICAQCFGAGLAEAGFSGWLLSRVGSNQVLVYGLALLFPLLLAMLTGSGSGPVLTFGQTLLNRMPSAAGIDLGALATLSGAFGRSLSPVSAVVLYTAGLAEVSALEVVRGLALPLAAGACASYLTILLN